MTEFLEFWPFLLPLMAAQLGLMIYALHHILTHDRFRRGTRILWIIVSVAFNFVGPICYFLLGKED